MAVDDAFFANLYIEKVVAEVVELTKIRLMAETRIAYLEKVNADLLAQLETQYRDRDPDPDIFDHEELSMNIN